ncbi:DUF1403 domain-containing protein [Paracoccus nototheniae]|uniref:DUF1403 family protein n=1 Tax=Paracoccus nototheniae TaxID=2489002 RepID=A0ABW4DU29_9RHOB|nr:DUF1403 family protein [Paracoccus nototheniae]
MTPSRAPSNSDPGGWLAAQTDLTRTLAEVAAELGRLDGTLLALPPLDATGALQRLALAEVEAMLWSQGTILRRDEIGRDMMDARAVSDPQTMRQARWALRRLQGQGDRRDLAGFLGLHRSRDPQPDRDPADPDLDRALALRPRGIAFDEAAAEFLQVMDAAAGLHPLARGPLAMILWRLAGLSTPELTLEAAVWSARDMAQGCEALSFVPLGRHGRRVWTGFGPPGDRLTAHLTAIAAAAREGRAQIGQIARWAKAARTATHDVKGSNPARVIAVLAARPLVSAMQVEAEAGISRITAERMLNRMTAMGLIRETTGGRRFRLWAANLAMS